MTTGRDSGNERRPDGAAFVIAVVLALVAIIIFISTNNMPAVAAYTAVGPRTVPYIVSICLFGLAIWTALDAWRGKFPKREEQNLGPIFWIVAGLTAQLLLIKTVGFSIATGLLFAATAKAFGRGPLWKTALIGIVFSFVVWFVFAKGLQLTLPEGPIEQFFRLSAKAA
ncbi:MAG: tripartite tricarboxylate transporter TctB family protein [Rhizobiaceae bacterium]